MKQSNWSSYGDYRVTWNALGFSFSALPDAEAITLRLRNGLSAEGAPKLIGGCVGPASERVTKGGGVTEAQEKPYRLHG